MELTQSTIDSIPVIKLKGRFDAHEIEPINAWLQEQVGQGNVKLLINLEGVNFIDSTALSTLVRGLKHCREKNGDLHLCNLQQPVRVIFELTRLDKAFDIFPTDVEAGRSF